MGEKILVVEDDPRVLEMVRLYLERAGYQVRSARDGPGALKAFQAEQPALIVLDLGLPWMDGLEVCREIRRTSNVPIVVLTARAAEADRVRGLELGADDYIVKPFSPRELVARVRAILRRTRPPELLRTGELVIDLRGRQVRVGERPVELTLTEFELLAFLARHPGQVFPRSELLEHLQNCGESWIRTIDTHIWNLRRKLEPDPKRPQYILTVRGVGYKFRRDRP